MSFAFATYGAVRVETASPIRLVVVLYRGAIRFMRQATTSGGEGDLAARGRALGRAHSIVSELQATLDHSRAPALCQELDRLYDFVLFRITEANVTGDLALLGPAIDVMSKLESAWAEIAGDR